MQVKAKLNYLRIAPRKVRLVADLIRRKKVVEAETILNFAVKKTSLPLKKLLLSAVANAKNNFQLNPNNLYISKITVDEGPKLKRWMPRARGQAYEIQKKSSHITIILDEIKPEKGPKKRKKSVKKIEEIKKEGIIQVAKDEKKEPEFKKQKPELRSVKETKPNIVKRIFRRKSF